MKKIAHLQMLFLLLVLFAQGCDRNVNSSNPKNDSTVVNKDSVSNENTTDKVPAETAEIDEKNCFDIKDNVLLKYNCSETVVTIPEGILRIESFAFTKLLNKVVINSQLKEIGADAFSLTFLREIVFPESAALNKIERSAFAGCHLKSIILPFGLETIESNAFGSNEISTIILPLSLKSIGAYAFSSNNISEIVIPSEVSSIGESAFAFNKIKSLRFTNDTSTSPEIIIKDYAFFSNEIESVEMPYNFGPIGFLAFMNEPLKKVIFTGKSFGNGNPEELAHVFWRNVTVVFPDKSEIQTK
jgi:hypothetical protein